MDGTAGNATSELSVEGLAAGYTHDALEREGREIERWAAVNYNKYNRARTLAAVSWDLRRHATIRAYRTEGCEKELEWAHGVGRFASFLSARYGVPRPLIVNLLEGEAAMFAHRLISALQLPGGYNNAIWWVKSSHRLSVFQYFMGRSSPNRRSASLTAGITAAGRGPRFTSSPQGQSLKCCR